MSDYISREAAVAKLREKETAAREAAECLPRTTAEGMAHRMTLANAAAFALAANLVERISAAQVDAVVKALTQIATCPMYKSDMVETARAALAALDGKPGDQA